MADITAIIACTFNNHGLDTAKQLANLKGLDPSISIVEPGFGKAAAVAQVKTAFGVLIFSGHGEAVGEEWELQDANKQAVISTSDFAGPLDAKFVIFDCCGVDPSASAWAKKFRAGTIVLYGHRSKGHALPTQCDCKEPFIDQVDTRQFPRLIDFLESLPKDNGWPSIARKPDALLQMWRDSASRHSRRKFSFIDYEVK